MQMSLFMSFSVDFVQKSLFYILANVFRHLNVGVKTMKCWDCFWQTAKIIACASCSFKHQEIRPLGLNWDNLIVPIKFHTVQ